MTPADLLRAAATKLREAATAARSSSHHITAVPKTPWLVVECINGCPCIVVQGSGEPPDEYLADAETPELAAYIALMHPGAGSALADWLDQAAKSAEANVTAAHRVWANSDDTESRDKWIAEMTDRHALATARALLGEVAP